MGGRSGVLVGWVLRRHSQANRVRCDFQTERASVTCASPRSKRYRPSRGQVLYASRHGESRLQLHAEPVVAKPRAVRQRDADSQLSEPISLDPAAWERPVPCAQSRLVSRFRRKLFDNLQSRFVEAAIYVSILKSR